VHEGALTLAEKDAHEAGVGESIKLYFNDISHFRPLSPPSLLVTNPPWGLRLETESFSDFEDQPPESVWKNLGEFLRRECAGVEANILCGSPTVSGALRLRSRARYPLSVGGIDCRLLAYTLLPAMSEEHDEGDNAGMDQGESGIKNMNNIVCHKCGEVGHISRTCPNADKCRLCGNKGHFARDCKSNKQLLEII